MMRNKLLGLVLLFGFMSVGQTAVHEDLAKIQIVTEEYPPYNYTENGQVTGLSTEIVHAVLKKLDVDLTITVYPWIRAYKMVSTEPNVMIYTIGRTSEREALFKWAGVLVNTKIYFYKLKSRNDIQINTLEDTKRYMVEAVREDVNAKYLERNQYPNVSYTKTYLNDAMLNAHRIDLTLLNPMVLPYALQGSTLLQENDFERSLEVPELATAGHMAFSLSTPDEVVEAFKTTLDAFKQTPEYTQILRKYHAE
jgi:polar amino acid transport system substrate-binding protein